MNVFIIGIGIAASCVLLACATTPTVSSLPTTTRPAQGHPALAFQSPFGSTRSDSNGADPSSPSGTAVHLGAAGNHADASNPPNAAPPRADAASRADRTEQSSQGVTSGDFDSSVFLSTLSVGQNQLLRYDEVRLFVRLKDGPFGELTRRQLAAEIRNQQLTVRVPEGYPVSNDAVLPQHRACSYVIDCNVEPMRSLGLQELSSSPDVVRLTNFAELHITRKSLARGFDVASDVARHGEGDCTEHAVLLAALLRRHRYSARVVLGLVVLRRHGRLPLIVGHAWTETHDGHGWQVADAALTRSGIAQLGEAGGLSYLPVQILREESAAFQVSLFSVPGTWHVERAEAPLADYVR